MNYTKISFFFITRAFNNILNSNTKLYEKECHYQKCWARYNGKCYVTIDNNWRNQFLHVLFLFNQHYKADIESWMSHSSVGNHRVGLLALITKLPDVMEFYHKYFRTTFITKILINTFPDTMRSKTNVKIYLFFRLIQEFQKWITHWLCPYLKQIHINILKHQS